MAAKRLCANCRTETGMSMLGRIQRAQDGTWLNPKTGKRDHGPMSTEEMALVGVCGAYACQVAIKAKRDEQASVDGLRESVYAF